MSPPNNWIDANEANKIGEFLRVLREEVDQANRDCRASALQSSDLDTVSSYVGFKNFKAQYTLELDVGKQVNGVAKKKSSEVIIETELETVRPPDEVSKAPFNVLFGVIAPAERNRKEIEELLISRFSNIEKNLPIFSLGESRFWIPSIANDTHFVVELNTRKAIVIEDLDQLNKYLLTMMSFLSNQLSKVYGS